MMALPCTMPFARASESKCTPFVESICERIQWMLGFQPGLPPRPLWFLDLFKLCLMIMMDANFLMYNILLYIYCYVLPVDSVQ